MSYLGCVLHETMSHETMALRVIEKHQLYAEVPLSNKSRFLDVLFRRLLYNALIHCHFHCVCTARYLNSTKNLKDKGQVTQKNALDYNVDYNEIKILPNIR